MSRSRKGAPVALAMVQDIVMACQLIARHAADGKAMAAYAGAQPRPWPRERRVRIGNPGSERGDYDVSTEIEKKGAATKATFATNAARPRAQAGWTPGLCPTATDSGPNHFPSHSPLGWSGLYKDRPTQQATLDLPLTFSSATRRCRASPYSRASLRRQYRRDQEDHQQWSD